MEFKQLESFVAVVKYRSFTKAAEHLYISQPTISTHIRMLEEEFHSRLIIRTTKSIEITPRGNELYEFACQMLSQRDNLLRRWSHACQNEVQIGASTIPSAYILPEVLPKFRLIHPGVQFHIHQSDSLGVIDGLRNGSFELGLVGMAGHDDTIACIPFYQDSIVLITPVESRFAELKNDPEIPVELLLKEPFIMREQGSGTKKCMESYFEHIGIHEEELNITARLNDQKSIKSLVASGLGISIISEKAALNLSAADRILTFRLPKYNAVRSLYLAYRKDFILKDVSKRFLSFVQEFYAS